MPDGGGEWGEGEAKAGSPELQWRRDFEEGVAALCLTHTLLHMNSGLKEQACATRAGVTPTCLREIWETGGYGCVTPKEQVAGRCGHHHALCSHSAAHYCHLP